VAVEPNSVVIVQPVDKTRRKRPHPAVDGPADSEQPTGKVNPEAPGWTKRLVPISPPCRKRCKRNNVLWMHILLWFHPVNGDANDLELICTPIMK
jgi:hypothetical protein